MNQKIITIFGTSKAKEGDEIFQLAYELGRLCAEAGFTIANGGYKGTMMAAAKGANLAGGKVIGVTCSAFGTKGPNEFVTQNIITENLAQRVASIEESIKIKDKKIEHLENENKYIKNQIAILNQKMAKFEYK